MQSVEATTSLSEQLIEICSAPVAGVVRHRAAQHVLDWLGTILAGQNTETGQAVIQFAATKQFASGNCFVCGHTDLEATGAAFINGGLGNILELDDVHRVSILHAGDTIIPAVLAAAQKQNITLRNFLECIAQGYEFAIRLGVVAASGGYSNWYNSGTCGVFGAAFGCGRVLNLNSSQLKDCIGQAGMLASGLWQCRYEQTFSKQLATAHAAANGVLAALLGEQGFKGARFILEGVDGFFPTYYPRADLQALNLEPVDDWQLNQVSFKPWPSCRHTHPAIEAALALAVKISCHDIKSIQVNTYQAAIDFCDNPHPKTDHEARFSLQHCTAVALIRGEPSIPDFDETSRSDPLICRLRQKIRVCRVEEYQQRFPSGMGSGLVAILRDDSELRYSVEHARGDPENPMNVEELNNKFLKLASSAGISEQQSNRLTRTLGSADNASNADFNNRPLQSFNWALRDINNQILRSQ